MDIQEYRPDPARFPPPPPDRKGLSTLIMSLILVGTFFVSLAIMGRHEIADYTRQHFAESSTPQAVQPSRARSVPPPSLAGQKIQGNVERAINCIPANVLSADEIDQLNAAIAVLPANSPGTTAKALSADSFDPHKMTTEQARDTLQVLVQIKGPLGDRALQALNQSISEGPCKIHVNTALVAQPETQQQKPAPSPFL